MNYEFHVGDYVETQTGIKGYISKVNDDKNNGYWIITDLNNRDSFNYVGDEIKLITSYYGVDAYNRIGEYAFIEPKKIEKLPSGDGCVGVSDNLIDKINELVDAVNKLKKRNKECFGCTYFEDE